VVRGLDGVVSDMSGVTSFCCLFVCMISFGSGHRTRVSRPVTHPASSL
jgi:hypothetical protein